MSVIGKKAEILVTAKDGVKIVDTVGVSWDKSDSGNYRRINVKNLIAEMNRDYLLEVEISALKDQKELEIVGGELIYEAEDQ